MSGAVRAPARPSIVADLVETFADGKWHATATIASKLAAQPDQIHTALEPARIKRYDCAVEKKLVGKDIHYRIFRLHRAIPADEIVEKLTPILKGLEHEGRANQVTMSVTAVAILAGRLRKLFVEWTEGPSGD